MTREARGKRGGWVCLWIDEADLGIAGKSSVVVFAILTAVVDQQADATNSLDYCSYG